ncbi:MAG: Tol-Pal system protein TolB, partial [Acetobacteraceae bacterium]|nr:Tol-Pal system protein TolB [Acetobacteraceae bacterium]
MSLPTFDRRRLLLGGGAAIAATALPASSFAQQPPEIVIQRARTDPLPIAIPDFASAGADRFARDIPAVITNNLRGSGLFRPLDR